MLHKIGLAVAVICLFAVGVSAQTPAVPGWSFSTAGGFSNVSNAPTNNGFVNVTELRLSEYYAVRGDVFLMTNPQVIGSYISDMQLPGTAPLIGSAAVILAAAVIASVVPAARAARVDTVQALRAD